MARTKFEQNLVNATRSHIKDGHERYAPFEIENNYIEQLEEQLKNGCSCNQNGIANQNGQEDSNQMQGGYNILQHPDFIKNDGLPSPFNPDPDQNIKVGEAILNEYNMDPFAKDLSKDALKDKLKNQLKLKQQLQNKPKHQPKMSVGNAPRPRPSGPS